DDFEAGRVYVPHLRILRVERATADATARRAAHDHGRGRSPAPVALGYRVADLRVRGADEVHELELGHGAHAGHGRAVGRRHDGGFRDRRIDHALFAEVVDEAFSDLERAA